ncbi:MAG: dihydropteroate synthase [Acidimicrobiia bacterium]
MQHPRLMAVLNASPDSFSGAVVDAQTVGARAVRAAEDGASILDVGGQSLRTDQPELEVEVEAGRSVPVIAECRAALDAAGIDNIDISVDTYRAPVALAAIDAGATIVNDASGLRDPAMVDVITATGVQVVVTYNRAKPKVRLSADQLIDDPVTDGLAFLQERIDALLDAGVAERQILVDPGPDLGKSPAQTIAVLRALPRFRTFGRPLLLALSRKDFIGAVTHTLPPDRASGLDGVLAVLDLGAEDVLRVHEPARVRDFYAMSAVVSGAVDVSADLELPVHLRHKQAKD